MHPKREKRNTRRSEANASKINRLEQEMASLQVKRGRTSRRRRGANNNGIPGPRDHPAAAYHNAALEKYGATPSDWNTSLVPFSKLAGAHLTESGIRWAINSMDPAACSGAAEGRIALGGKNPGVPDFKTGNILMVPTALSETFGPPDGITESQTWDMCVIITPIPECPFIVFKRISGSGDDWNDMLAQTWDLNSTGSNASWWYLPDYLPSGQYPSTRFSHLRLVSRSVTGETVGAMLYKGGTITSGQVPSNIMFTPHNPSDKMAGEAWETPVVGSVCWKFPYLGSGELVQYDRLMKQRDATLGDYNVLRCSEPVGYPLDNPTMMGGQLAVCKYDQTQYNDVNWDLSSHHVTYGSSFNTGLVYWEAIAPENNIRLKLHGFLEGTPYMGGPYAALTSTAPESDFAAIQLVNDITNELPHSYPASYNDLGGLLGTIGHIVNSVSGVLGGLGIPVVSGIAQVVHHVSGALLNH